MDTDLYPAGEWKSISDYRIRFKGDFEFNNLKDPSWTNPKALKWLELMMNSGYEHNDTATLGLMKTSSWDPKYTNNRFAEYTIGGPTVEMVWDTFDNLIPEGVLEYTKTIEEEYGYPRGAFSELTYGIYGYSTYTYSPYLMASYDDYGNRFFDKTEQNKMLIPETATPDNTEWVIESGWVTGLTAIEQDTVTYGTYGAFYPGGMYGGDETRFDTIMGTDVEMVSLYSAYLHYVRYKNYEGTFEDFCLEEWGEVPTGEIWYSYPGVRPVVCLKSGVTLEEAGDGSYNLIPADVVVVPNQTTLEITEGDSNTFDSLFTVTTRDGGIATKTYTLNGEPASANSNTSTLTVGTHTITCTATYNGISDTASITVRGASAVPEEETLLATVKSSSIDVTIPNGVSCIKVTTYEKPTLDTDPVGGGAEKPYLSCNGVKIASDSELVNAYLKVTPGKMYTFLGSGNSFKLWYSASINESTPDFDLDAPVVTFTQVVEKDDMFEQRKVTVSITPVTELNLAECRYALADWGLGFNPTDANSWEEMLTTVGTYGPGKEYELTSLSFTQESSNVAVCSESLHLKLVDVSGNVYYFTSPYSLSNWII